METQLSDAALLREFASDGAQAAFRTLVERHQDMVFSVARRRLGRDDAAADVAQNVFLALARKAAWLSGRSSVGGWLYKSTLLEAARRQRDDGRRLNRERLFAEDMNSRHSPSFTDPAEASNVADCLRLLDDAMAGLSPDDREALVLRFFRGLSLRETGQALGTSEEAARKRVGRSLEKLAGLFRRRGVAVPAAVLAGSVLPRAIDAAPASLGAQIAAAVSGSPGTGLAGSLYLKAIAMTKVQTAAACLVAAAMPVAWQWKRIDRLNTENHRLADEVAAIQGAPSPPPPPAAAGPAVASADPGTASGRERRAADRPDSKPGSKGPRGHFMKWREAERQQQREARLAAMREQVGLDDAQYAVVAEAEAQAEARRRTLRESAQKTGGWPTPEDEAAVVQAREAAVLAVLDDDQREAYAEFLTHEARNRQEIYANRMLGEIQGTLLLSDDQKDRVFEIFAGQAAALEEGGDRLPNQPFGEASTERLKEILTEEQFKIWQQRIDLWARFFESAPGPPRAADSRPPGPRAETRPAPGS